MGRLLLAVWIAIYTLVGPGVCCCTFAASISSAASSETLTSSPKKTRKCCCPENMVSSNGTRSDQKCPENQCPCQRAKADVRLDSPAAVEISGLFRSLIEVLPDLLKPLAIQTPISAEQSIHQTQSDLPFLTTDTLLRAFHNLRC